MAREIYYISDGTGLTAESLGGSLLSQFGDTEFKHHTLSYVKNDADVAAAVHAINITASRTEKPPIVFMTLVELPHREAIKESDALVFDIFSMFMLPLTDAIGEEPDRSAGKNRKITSRPDYIRRIDAIHFALDNDDGAITRYYDKADIIITGVSRVGKTPTCIYLALQYGLFTANYPITDDDLDDLSIPMALREHRKKLFGLVIDPERLSAIRNERKPGSRYATLRQCESEVRGAMAMFQRFGIPWLDSTELSIEEISAKILQLTGIERKIH
ncbi:MAG: pyruvate, water dikinase regulatory protein [Pseudomonadota bacterium]|nr:pyruvate, water dikinase regulatory protein [Pseudomonadota bacterium]